MIRLSVQHREAVRDFLRMDVATNIYVLSLLEQAERKNLETLVSDGEVFASPSPRHIEGLLYVSRHGLMVPYALDEKTAFGMGDFFRGRVIPRMLVGPRDSSDAFWRGLKPHQEARIARAHQLYTLRSPQLVDSQETAVRLAIESDLERCCALAAEMQEEELGINPMTVDPERFQKRIQGLIANQAVTILPHGIHLAFQASAESRCKEGVQIQGVITPQTLRGRGFASRGLAKMCRLLFDDYPLVTLHVNEENTSAIRLYERLGFVSNAPFRLISY